MRAFVRSIAWSLCVHSTRPPFLPPPGVPGRSSPAERVGLDRWGGSAPSDRHDKRNSPANRRAEQASADGRRPEVCAPRHDDGLQHQRERAPLSVRCRQQPVQEGQSSAEEDGGVRGAGEQNGGVSAPFTHAVDNHMAARHSLHDLLPPHLSFAALDTWATSGSPVQVLAVPLTLSWSRTPSSTPSRRGSLAKSR